MVGEEHSYRETVSVWFRSVFTLQPDIDAMAAAPLSFQLHTLVGMLLFVAWPFTRLVHAFTVPRPYIVYRSRTPYDPAPGRPAGDGTGSAPDVAAGSKRRASSPLAVGRRVSEHHKTAGTPASSWCPRHSGS